MFGYLCLSYLFSRNKLELIAFFYSCCDKVKSVKISNKTPTLLHYSLSIAYVIGAGNSICCCCLLFHLIYFYLEVNEMLFHEKYRIYLHYLHSRIHKTLKRIIFMELKIIFCLINETKSSSLSFDLLNNFHSINFHSFN